MTSMLFAWEVIPKENPVPDGPSTVIFMLQNPYRKYRRQLFTTRSYLNDNISCFSSPPLDTYVDFNHQPYVDIITRGEYEIIRPKANIMFPLLTDGLVMYPTRARYSM